MKEVIKKGTVINLYYLNFLGTVMLRPVLVILGGGAGGDSSPSTPLAPPVHLSTRFLLGACFFEVVAWVIWDCCAIFLELPLEPSFPSPSSSPLEPFHKPPFSPLPAASFIRQQ
jgi:hypothetical protein